MTTNRNAKQAARRYKAENGGSYTAAHRNTGAPAHPTYAVGDRLRFAEDRFWWTVQAVSPDFVVLTRQREFAPKGQLVYTIIDWESELRGPANYIGGGYDVRTPGGADRLLAELDAYRSWMRRWESGERGMDSVPDTELSFRRSVPLHFA